MRNLIEGMQGVMEGKLSSVEKIEHAIGSGREAAELLMKRLDKERLAIAKVKKPAGRDAYEQGAWKALDDLDYMLQKVEKEIKGGLRALESTLEKISDF